MVGSRSGAGPGREVSLPGILLVAALAFGGGYWGLAAGGTMVGLLGALGGALVGFAVYFVLRGVRMHRALSDRPAPQVLDLPPDQALSVLSAMVNRDGGGASLASEVLTSLAAIKKKSEEDLDGALVDAEDLRRKHPRSPAIAAELARLHQKRGAEQSTAKAASEAIALALDGGMNSVAGRVFADFESARPMLELEKRHWKGLAKVLEAREMEEETKWCLARAVDD